jgi:hypothetical protein
VDHRRPDAIGHEGLGGLAQQVLEPDRGLPDLGSGATGGQEQRDGRSRALEHEALQIGSTDHIHGEPPYIQASTCSLGGLTLAEAVQRRLCAEQLGPEGFEDRLGPDVQPCPVLAQLLQVPLQLGRGILARRTVSTSSRVSCGASSIPHHGHLPARTGPSTSWLSNRSRWQLPQVAVILMSSSSIK